MLGKNAFIVFQLFKINCNKIIKCTLVLRTNQKVNNGMTLGGLEHKLELVLQLLTDFEGMSKL